MTALAPILQGFFTDKLIRQRQRQPEHRRRLPRHLPAAARFAFAHNRSRPEQTRPRRPGRRAGHRVPAPPGNRARQQIATRNARLAAIHSLFRYAALRAPEHADQISRVLAIPPKRCDRAIVCFLTPAEIDALLAAPDRATWLGRRDHALLLLTCQTGLRVSELTALTRSDLHLGAGAHVRCHGKGRKDRATPLTRQTVAALRVWLAEHDGGAADPAVPHPDRPPAVPRRRRPSSSPNTPPRAAARLPVHRRQERHPAHPAAHRRHGAAARRSRHLGHRALARPRGPRLHPGLPARRHDDQGTSPRPRPTTRHQPRPLPTTRHPAHIPRQPLTPDPTGLCRPPNADTPSTSTITPRSA